MAIKCPKCKKYNLSDAKFCEYCGNNLVLAGVRDTPKSVPEQETKGNIIDDFMGWFNQQSTAIKAALGIVGVCFIGIILIVAIGSLTPEQNNTVSVQNVKYSSSGYGSHGITASITPNKDFDYLEMVIVWYDASGAVIDRDSLAWNVNDAKKGQTYIATATTYLNNNVKPAKFDLMIYNHAFSDNSTKPIFTQTYNV